MLTMKQVREYSESIKPYNLALTVYSNAIIFHAFDTSAAFTV